MCDSEPYVFAVARTAKQGGLEGSKGGKIEAEVE